MVFITALKGKKVRTKSAGNKTYCGKYSKIKEKVFRKGEYIAIWEGIRRKLEGNPAAECNKARKKYCPGLFRDFAGINDPSPQSYTEYSNKEMLGTMFYKGTAGISSMQSMTHEFNSAGVAGNISHSLGERVREYLPREVTVNEYLERLDSGELQKVQQKQVYGLIWGKTFYGSRFLKRWLVIVDGIQLYSGSRKLNDKCLERYYNEGTDKEAVNYHYVMCWRQRSCWMRNW